ncbi:MAG TPA: cysteine hydrolase [Thermoleophilaceae bacterium]|nr:cysteine hydrolase [Thermoleophilaceae bacterium]
MKDVAVVLVDVQRDFLDRTTPAGVGSWEKAFCVPGIERLLDHARDQGWQVLHVGTKHDDASTLPNHHRRKEIPLYCQDGTPGCEFVIPAREDEPVLYKHWYSAFDDSGLEDHLSENTTIVWAGVASDCCIQQSAFEADHSGRHTVVPFQAVSASHRPAYVGSLVGMAKSACDVADLADILDRGIEAPALEVDAIEERSRAWYTEQQALLPEGDESTLETVLDRLRSRAAL